MFRNTHRFARTPFDIATHRTQSIHARIGTVLLALLVILASSGCSYVEHRIESTVLEPTNLPEDVSPDSPSWQKELLASAQRYPQQIFSEHYTVTVDDPPARLSYWRYEPPGFKAIQPQLETPAGSSGTVILLQGWSGSTIENGYLYNTAGALYLSGFHVFMADLRGQGHSTGAACSYGHWEAGDVSQIAQDLENRGLIQGRLAVVGHSYGAAVALQAAAADPRFGAAVCLSGQQDLLSLRDPILGYAKQRTPWLYGIGRFFVTDALVHRAIRTAAERHGFEPEQASALQAMPRLKVPVLLVYGAQDINVPPAHGDSLYAARPERTRYPIYRDSDHWAYLYNQRAMNGVAKWLKTSLTGDAPEGQEERVLPPPPTLP